MKIFNLLIIASLILFFFNCSKTTQKKTEKVEEVEEPKIEVIDLSDDLKKEGYDFKLVVPNILFAYRSTEVTYGKESIQKVIAFIEKMLKYDDIEYEILVVGHTDSRGTEEFNQKLSEERAKKIYDILVAKDFNNVVLGYKGRGEGYPIIADEEKVLSALIGKKRREQIEINYRLNRRVEFFFKVIKDENNRFVLPNVDESDESSETEDESTEVAEVGETDKVAETDDSNETKENEVK